MTTRPAGGRTVERRSLFLPVRHGYGFLLGLIVATYVLALAADARWLVTLLVLVQTATVWQALRTSGARAGLRLAGAIVFTLALIAAFGNLFSNGTPLAGLAFLAASALYIVAPIAIVHDIGHRRGVDEEMMYGALAAYLLIGMAFGFAYACVAALQPGPFFTEAADPTLGQTLFFSFVTMTTTGYGDLVPSGNPGQSIAVLEALIGQLFLVTAVAKVVENWRPRAWRRSGDDEDPPPPE